jgi:hypothetical protein
MKRYTPPFVLAFCAIVIISGCQNAASDSDDAREGTYVGNPGEMRARIAPINDAELDFATAHVAGVDFIGCDETTEEWVPVDGMYDLKSHLYIGVPPGDWCHISMDVVGINAAGFSNLTGGTFEMFLEPGNISMDTFDPMVSEDAFFVMEFGRPGWTSAAEINVAEDDHIVINQEHGFFNEFSARINEGTGVYGDEGDGFIDETERQENVIAQVVPDEEFLGDDDDDNGDTDEPTDVKQCGCTSTQSGGVAFWALGILLVGWRNRRY